MDDEGGWAWRTTGCALIFACCHPALALDVRVALTLRYLAGLTTGRSPARSCCPNRPWRSGWSARNGRSARPASGSRYRRRTRSPTGSTRCGASSTWCSTRGTRRAGGDGLVRVDLCEEAIWLGRVLHRLLPADAETAGLLALMLLHHARAPARQDAGRAPGTAGGAGPVALATRADRRGYRRCSTTPWPAATPGPYQLQAAIAALHAGAELRRYRLGADRRALRRARAAVPVAGRGGQPGRRGRDGGRSAGRARGTGAGARLGASWTGTVRCTRPTPTCWSARAIRAPAAAWARAAAATANPALRDELQRRVGPPGRAPPAEVVPAPPAVTEPGGEIRGCCRFATTPTRRDGGSGGHRYRGGTAARPRRYRCQRRTRSAPSRPRWTLVLTAVAFFMVTLDSLVVMTALPVMGRDLNAGALHIGVDGQRLRADLCRRHRHLRRARRPVRAAPGLHRRPGVVHGRLSRVRAGAHGRDADRRPGGAGGRRRGHHPVEPDHPHRRLLGGEARARSSVCGAALAGSRSPVVR